MTIPKRVEVPSYPVSIFIAGRASDIEDQCRTYADEVGFCVTATPSTYIYTGGEEEGYIIGLINYPRFPMSPETIWGHAETLAERLRLEASQESYTIQAPDKTVWFSWREQDAAQGGVTREGGNSEGGSGSGEAASSTRSSQSEDAPNPSANRGHTIPKGDTQ